jgi:uncharacterized NAD(P)/FAD-binding protein YdhS
LGRGLPRRITESRFPDLPDDFVEWFRKRNNKPIVSLREIAEAFQEWKRGQKGVST